MQARGDVLAQRLKLPWQIASCILAGGMLCMQVGCNTSARTTSQQDVTHAIERYAADRATAPPLATESSAPRRADLAIYHSDFVRSAPVRLAFDNGSGQSATSPATQPSAAGPNDTSVAPPGYWRRNLLHQMGYEAREFGTRGVWEGFESAFWDLENALALTVAMGASVTIRETGVDDTIRNRTHGNRQLGDFDEPIQLLGNPATHFAGTGVLWLTSTLTRDVEQHELAKSLTKALAVNGITTMALKATTRTRAPNGDRLAWPSGHTSSAFTVAAVLNERYGPWVGVPSLALAGLVGYQRIDSRVHDFSDVIVGGMLGYVVGTSIARDDKAEFPEVYGMQVLPFVDPETGAAGIALHKAW